MTTFLELVAAALLTLCAGAVMAEGQRPTPPSASPPSGSARAPSPSPSPSPSPAPLEAPTLASSPLANPIGPTGGRVGAAEVPIVGGNLASARERALSEALKQAVEQAVTALIPDARASQPKTVVQVLGRARAYVRRYRALEEGERGRGLYGVRIEADVDESTLLRAFDKPGGAVPAGAESPAASSTSAPSYLLVGAGAADALESAAHAFTAAGARVQSAGPEQTDPARAIEAAGRAGIATVAFISGSVTAEGTVRGPGLQSASCVLGVRVVAAGAGGLPVADESATVRSFAERPETARGACFRRAAAAVIPRIVPIASARVTPDLRTIVLDAAVVQPAAVPALVKQVRAIGSVSATEVRRVAPGRVELWVRSRMAAAALVAALGRDAGGALTFGPAEVTGDLVRVTATLREPSSPASPPAGSPAAAAPPGVPPVAPVRP